MGRLIDDLMTAKEIDYNPNLQQQGEIRTFALAQEEDGEADAVITLFKLGNTKAVSRHPEKTLWDDTIDIATWLRREGLTVEQIDMHTATIEFSW